MQNSQKVSESNIGEIGRNVENFESVEADTTQKSFPLMISSVNMNKSAVSYGFGQNYWRDS